MDAKQHLAEKQAERDGIIDRAIVALKADTSIVAAWLGGSLGRGDGDAWSDVDLWVVARDEAMQAVSAGRRQFVEMLGRPILISEAPQNAPPGGAYLWVCYPGKYGPQHVDWNWLPQSGASISKESLLLFDKAGLCVAHPITTSRPQGAHMPIALTQECAFFWGMCMVAAKYIARGTLFDSLLLMDMPAYSLSKVAWLLGGDEPMTYREHAWGTRPAPFGAAEQLALLRELAVKMEDLHPRIGAAGGQVPSEAVREIYSLFDLVDIH